MKASSVAAGVLIGVAAYAAVRLARGAQNSGGVRPDIPPTGPRPPGFSLVERDELPSASPFAAWLLARHPGTSAAALAARQDDFLRLIANGEADISWSTITLGRVRLRVTSYPVGKDGVFFPVSARGQQAIADKLDALLPTPKISDEMFLQASGQITPCPQPISASSQTTVNHADCVAKKIDKLPVSAWGLFAPIGKIWCLTAKLPEALKKNRALNYGWQVKTDARSWAGIGLEATPVPGLRVIQGVGAAHDPGHIDYSQCATLVHRECEVDGKPGELADVLRSAELAPDVSYDGPLSVLRYPL